MSVGVKGAEIRDLGETAKKESVTESGAAREEALLPCSAPEHSGLAAAAQSAAPAGGTGRGTARGWPSDTGHRSRWALAERTTGPAAPWDCGESPYSELGLRFPRPFRSPEALRKQGKKGKDGGGSSMSVYSRKSELAR